MRGAWRRGLAPATVILAMIGGAGVAAAQTGAPGEPPAAAAKAPEPTWPSKGTLLDGIPPLADGRKWLADHGVTLRLQALGIWQTLADGGLGDEGDTRGSGGVFASALLDSGKLGLWDGTKVSAGIWQLMGVSLTDDREVGDLYNTNFYLFGYQIGRRFGRQEGDAAGVPFYWISHTLPFGDFKLTGRVGKIATIRDYDVSTYAGNEATQFLNRSLFKNPTIPFRRFPLGADLFLEHPKFTLRTGLYDAQPRPWQWGFHSAFRGRDDEENAPYATIHEDPAFLSITELALKAEFAGDNGALPGTYRFGFWLTDLPYPDLGYDTKGGTRPRATRTGNGGAYATFDQLLYREAGDPKVVQGLGMFLRVGHGKSTLNPVSGFVSVGLSYAGLLPMRDKDVLALGYSYGKLEMAQGLAPALVRKDEQVLEAFYNCELLPFLHITPHAQVVIDPAAPRTTPVAPEDAWIVGLRVEVVF